MLFSDDFNGLSMHASIRQRIAWLRDQIERHNRLYYVEAAPEISDREYDVLFDELAALERAHPETVTPDSPTQRVGGEPLKQFAHVTHRPPMLSLEKAENADALQRFDARLRKALDASAPVAYVVEPKVDGVSIALRYESGVLVLAATRGNGSVGDDITANARTIRGVPLRLAEGNDYPQLLEVRGEVYMDRAAFAALNERLAAAGEKTFPSTRNAAAGSLKQLDPRTVAKRPLRIVVYAVATLEDWPYDNHFGSLQTLKRLGFPVPRRFWHCADMDAALARAEECKQLSETLPYDIDGAVIKLNRLSDWARLGATAHHPQYAIAYKPRHWLEQAQTRLRDITIQVGRTGVLTPVAELEPVFLAGSTIARATLHNADDIARKDIRIGDTVLIERAGMVIPAVVKPLPDKRSGAEKPFVMPSACPACGGTVVRQQTAGEHGAEQVAWRCENLQCPAQKTRRLEHFASRSALDIEGLGGIVADALVDQGWVDEPLDLFELDGGRLSTLNLGTVDKPRIFGPKNAAKLLAALERARSLPLNLWLFALAIPNVGTVTARRLAQLHPTLADVARSPILADILRCQELENAIKSGSRRRRDKTAAPQSPALSRDEDLKSERQTIKQRLAALELTDLGPVAARSVLDFFRSPQGGRIIERCARLGLDPQGGKTEGNERVLEGIAGKSFVVTGTLSGMSRSKAEERIRAAGGKVAAAVSGKTDYLVTGADPGVTKLRQAEQLGVARLSESDFLSLVGSDAQVAAPPASAASAAPSGTDTRPPRPLQGELPLEG